MVPIYEQLIDQLKNSIISGELKENDPLPSVRAFANELKISALTVKKAYDLMEAEGFVITVHGKGTYVAPSDNGILIEGQKKVIENELSVVVDKAKMIGMSREEFHELVDILMEE